MALVFKYNDDLDLHWAQWTEVAEEELLLTCGVLGQKAFKGRGVQTRLVKRTLRTKTALEGEHTDGRRTHELEGKLRKLGLRYQAWLFAGYPASA